MVFNRVAINDNQFCALQVDVVSTEAALTPALTALRASMTDPAIALDLEWRPDFGRGSSRVALVQLASGSRAVLVRVCRMGGQLPVALREFLRWGPSYWP